MCDVCKGPCSRTIEINVNAPGEVLSLFRDPSSLLKAAFKIQVFQERQKSNLLEYTRREVESLESQVQKQLEEDQEEERRYNEKLAEYKEVCEQEANLKAEIEQLFANEGAIGGVLSPSEYHDSSSSSSGPRHSRSKATEVLSPWSTPPPTEKPFLQMKTPAAWYEHKKRKNSPVMAQLQALEEAKDDGNNLKQRSKIFKFFTPN